MSYNTPPDPEDEFPKLFAAKNWFIAFIDGNPAKAWMYIWLVFTTLMLVMFLSDGVAAFTGRSAGVAVIGLVGWIIPLVLFLWANRREQRTFEKGNEQ